MSTKSYGMTMAAPAPGELEAMYDFFNLLELLFEHRWSDDADPEDMEGNYPEDWVLAAKDFYKVHEGEEIWKFEMVKWCFAWYAINAGWRRVIGGFDSLFSTFCDKDSTTLTYDTDHLKDLIEKAENCIVLRIPKPVGV